MTKEYTFHQDFEEHFKEKWTDVVSLVAEDRFNGEMFFYNQRNFFFEGLFVNQASFDEIYQSFQVWWRSLMGQFALTSSVEEYISSIYHDLAASSPKQNLYIALIYDDCLLCDLRNRPYFSILTIEQCLHGKDKLLERVQKSMR